MKTLWALLLAFTAGSALARQGIPVVDFVDVPVSASTSKAVAVVQVRAAITAAALINKWDVEPDGDALRLTLVENHFHTVVVKVSYSAAAYSVLYVDSKEMDYLPPDRAFTHHSSPGMAQDAIAKQQAKFARYAESTKAVPREGTLIHPFYEEWVIELLRGVRRQLIVAQ